MSVKRTGMILESIAKHHQARYYLLYIELAVTHLLRMIIKRPVMCLRATGTMLASGHTQTLFWTLLTLTDQFGGTDWQSLIIQALCLRYGTKLVEVPDQHIGDAGIEAFSLDGCAFQCYAPEGRIGLSEMAVKQKEKISRDLKKFQVNAVRLTKIFGSTKIHQWVLVVPNHCSSDVVTHCQKKTAEIRKLNPPLPYVAEDFQVLTVDGPTFFAVEIARLTNAGCILIEAEQGELDKTDIDKFSESNNQLLMTLQLKLAKLPLLRDPAERDSYTGKLLRMHLLGGNALAYYDNNFPLIADRIRSLKQTKTTALEIDSGLEAQSITKTREKFESELLMSVPALGRHTALILSYAAVAEWLMVCPLNPKG
jgi:hypothetical protein